MSPSSGRGRGRGARGGKRGGGEDGDASPEWLPPRQRRELEAEKAARSTAAGGSCQNSPPTQRALRSRIPVYNREKGHSQEFLNRPDIRAAAGLAERAALNEGGKNQVKGRIAMVLRRQQGDVWATRSPADQSTAQASQEEGEVDIEGVRVELVEEEGADGGVGAGEMARGDHPAAVGEHDLDVDFEEEFWADDHQGIAHNPQPFTPPHGSQAQHLPPQEAELQLPSFEEATSIYIPTHK